MKTKSAKFLTWLCLWLALVSRSHARPEYAPLLSRSDADTTKQYFSATRNGYHSSLQIIGEEIYVRVQLIDKAALMAFEQATLEVEEPTSRRRLYSRVAGAMQPDKTMLLECNVPKIWADHCVLRIWSPGYHEAADRRDFAGFELSCGDFIAQ